MFRFQKTLPPAFGETSTVRGRSGGQSASLADYGVYANDTSKSAELQKLFKGHTGMTSLRPAPGAVSHLRLDSASCGCENHAGQPPCTSPAHRIFFKRLRFARLGFFGGDLFLQSESCSTFLLHKASMDAD
jgi:hypothetical protein